MLSFQMEDLNLCHLAAAIIKEGERDIAIVGQLNPTTMVKIMQACGASDAFTLADFMKKHRIRTLRKANSIIIKNVVEKCYCQCLYKKK